MRIRGRILPSIIAGLMVILLFWAILSTWRPDPKPAPPAMLQTYDVQEPDMSAAPVQPPPAELTTTTTAAAPSIAAEPPPPPEETGTTGSLAPIEATVPRLAYVHKLGFRLAGSRIAAAQDSHRRICQEMGPARCQLLALERSAADDAETKARLKVRVASREAQRFADSLTSVVARAGGRAVETSVFAEDVSKEIVDTEARIRQRELLVARLTDILRNRTGRVAELVEAERSVAQAQEELDQAKGWLAELRGRVAMSDVEILYAAVAAQATPAVAGNQLGETIERSATAFLFVLRALLALLIYLAPWALVIVPVLLLVRRSLRATANPPASEAL